MATEAQAQKVKLWGGGVLMGLCAMSLVLLIAALYYLVENANQGQDTRRLLIECVVPPQERQPPVKVTNPAVDCYTRSQLQQGKAVNAIGDVTIRAACAAQYVEDVGQIDKCVENVTAYIKQQQP